VCVTAGTSVAEVRFQDSQAVDDVEAPDGLKPDCMKKPTLIEEIQGKLTDVNRESSTDERLAKGILISSTFLSAIYSRARVSFIFYRAMHFSAKRGIAIACRLSVRLSVRPSVCDVGEL